MTLPTTLRELVSTYEAEPWYKENEKDIVFELNHAELHSLDDYLLACHQKELRSSVNSNNSYLWYLLDMTPEAPTGPVKTTGGSFPDIDLDFEKERRDEVKQHLIDRYGADKVAAIGIFQLAKAKGVFKDVARMYDLPFVESNDISKLIDDSAESLEEALESSKELRAMYNSRENIKEIIDYAKELEGCIKAIGIHACGMCISTGPITELVPLFESKGHAVTQFDGPTLEKIGLIKYDILGLKNLTVISKTLELIKKTKGEVFTDEDIPLDDTESFKIIEEANSLGVFQIEGSQGLRDFAAAAAPKTLEEVAAVISLYRPGPMGMGALDHYIARRKGFEPSTFDVPEYDYIFKDTYGLLIFQEQLMILASDMCGFNDIETDVLRKAVGKKDRDLLLAQKQKFVDGAVRNGQPRQKISDLFDEMEEFARYCFNKSHAICYAKIGVQTAYLKTYYPSEYMAALISCEPDPEQQSMYIEDARRNGVEVLPPDINLSVKDFTVSKNGDILFGFNCIKGVGGRAVDKILSIQSFSSFGEFLVKAYHAKGINKKVIDALINCGSCDAFGFKRSCLLAGFEKFLMDYSTSIDKEVIHPDNPTAIQMLKDQDSYFKNDDLAEFPMLKILQLEKELLGIHISGNPFDIVATLVSEDYYTISEFMEGGDRGGFVLGQITKVKRLTTKTKKQMAFMDVSDEVGDHHSFVIFPDAYDKVEPEIGEGNYALIYARVKTDAKGKSLIVSGARDLTREIDKVSDKIEAESSMKTIDIHCVGFPGTVRLKSLIKVIEKYSVEQRTGYIINLCIDVDDTVFRMKSYNSKQIDIPMLRSFSTKDIYVSRGS